MKAKSDIPPARKTALAVLEDIFDSKHGKDVQAALDYALQKADLSNKDRALSTELVYGYLRLKGRIEALLAHFLKAPENLPALLHRILGLASYELLFLERIPDYASVDWAVNAVRISISPKLAGLSNAVLRNIIRLGSKAHEQNFYQSPNKIKALSQFYSCPEWIIRLWADSYKKQELEALLKAQITPPALGLSIPFDHAQKEQIHKKLASHPELLSNNGCGFAFPAGTFVEQSVNGVSLHRVSFAARQALMALEPHTWPQPIWDACAGRGGKTRILAELGLNVMASDVHKGRIAALQKLLPNIPAKITSIFDKPQFDKQPQTILLDVPCSGLGVLSRRPDAKWRRTEQDMKQLVQLQAEMLFAAAGHFSAQAKATLVYITCTLNPAENEEQVRNFIERFPAFTLSMEWSTPLNSPLNEFFYGARLCRV